MQGFGLQTVVSPRQPRNVLERTWACLVKDTNVFNEIYNLLNHPIVYRLPITPYIKDYGDFNNLGFESMLTEAADNSTNTYLIVIENINATPVECYLMPLLEYLNGECPTIMGKSTIPDNCHIMATISPTIEPSCLPQASLMRSWIPLKDKADTHRNIEFMLEYKEFKERYDLFLQEIKGN